MMRNVGVVKSAGMETRGVVDGQACRGPGGEYWGARGCAVALTAVVALLVAIPALVRRAPSLPIVYTLPMAGTPNGVALDMGADRAIVTAYNVAAFSNGSGSGSVALYDLRTGRFVRALTAFSQNVRGSSVASLRRAVVDG